MKVTGFTLTDEQLARLRAEAGLAGQHWIVTDTFTAVTLGRSEMFWHEVTQEEQDAARTRCAVHYNTRFGGE